MPICPIYLPSFDIADHHPLTGYLAQMSHQLRRDLRERTVYQPVCSRLMKVAQPALGFAYNFFFFSISPFACDLHLFTHISSLKLTSIPLGTAQPLHAAWVVSSRPRFYDDDLSV